MEPPDIMDFPGEREPLPYFAGRKAELAQLRATLERTVEQRRMEGGVTLIIGVPGSGKSALGREFVKGAIAAKGVRHCDVKASSLGDAVDVFEAMAEALDESDAALKVTDRDARGVGWSVGVSRIFRAGRTREHARRTPSSLDRMLQKSVAQGMWKRTKALILTIDELQNVDRNGAEVLRTLHEGVKDCPIFFLGMGLQHSPAVLSRLGISRVRHPIKLARLDDEDTRKAIVGNLNACGIRDVPESCMEKLAQASDGFPQHIQAYLAAAVEVVRERGALPAGETLEAVLAAGDARRIDYYQSRLRAMDVRSAHQAMLPIVTAMNDAGVDALDELEAVKLYDASDHEGTRVVDQAVAHGVLTVHADGTVGFGIPSFKQYITQWMAERNRGRTPSG